MMFAIVAIQNMITDFKIAKNEMISWTVQVKWQYSCKESIETLRENLRMADWEDVEEETDSRWFLPVVEKKVPKNGKWVQTNQYHEHRFDLSKILEAI